MEAAKKFFSAESDDDNSTEFTTDDGLSIRRSHGDGPYSFTAHHEAYGGAVHKGKFE